MIPFSSAEHPCAKCDSWTYKQDVRYEAISVVSVAGKRNTYIENLVRWCRTCHYQWEMEVKS